MATKNKVLHNQISNKILENSKNASSATDGVFVLSIHYNKKLKTSDIKVLINGLTPIEAEVLIKEVYARVYAERVKNDPRMKKLNEKLENAKGIVRK